jgi:hypothetical protein
VYVTIEDVALHYATEDTTGAILGGWLDLHGYLESLRLILDNDTGFIVSEGAETPGVYFSFEPTDP